METSSRENMSAHPSDIQKPATPPTVCEPSSVLEVDSCHIYSDDDEWMDDSASITSNILDYEFENGRRYHAYKAGHYPLPNDESELDRLDLQHHVVTLLLNGELHLAPLESPRKILDIGTGTGLWAIEMADRFPSATVIGTDLSPVQPTWVPDNVRFEVDDVESEWLYKENSFDYVHSRYMIGAISDWKAMIRKSFKHIKPGGYFEIQELDPPLLSDDGSSEKSYMHNMYVKLLCQSSTEYGKPVPKHDQYKAWLEEAGFVDVKEYCFKIPVNTWPKNKQLKEVGKYQLINYTEGCEGLCIGLFTRVLQWQPSEVQVLLARLRAELKDRTIHAYQPFVVVYGRKPFPTSRQSTPGGSLNGSRKSTPSRKLPDLHREPNGTISGPSNGATLGVP
ncbi:hypothetical protein MMC14_000916 [Varicellaria rhodocarpa]|nr:hypothetical protein [Varicellaria rhodocarpa]